VCFESKLERGGTYMDQIFTDEEHLTSREVDVLRLVAAGFSAKEIAIELEISP